MRKKFGISSLAGVAALASMAVVANAEEQQSRKIAADLIDQGGFGETAVIVQFKTPLTDWQVSKVRRQRRNFTSLPLVNGVVARLTRKQIEELSQDPEVEFIVPDREVTGSGLDFSPEAAGALVAAASPYNLTGAGIGVAVIDSGIDSYVMQGELYDWSANSTRVVRRESFVSGSGESDGYGHGSHVAGIIAGSGYNSSSSFGYFQMIPGVAPKANMAALTRLPGATMSGLTTQSIAEGPLEL